MNGTKAEAQQFEEYQARGRNRREVTLTAPGEAVELHLARAWVDGLWSVEVADGTGHVRARSTHPTPGEAVATMAEAARAWVAEVG